MIFIHPGFGKTATTFLQESIFSSQKKLTRLGDHIFQVRKKVIFFYVKN